MSFGRTEIIKDPFIKLLIFYLYFYFLTIPAACLCSLYLEFGLSGTRNEVLVHI